MPIKEIDKSLRETIQKIIADGNESYTKIPNYYFDLRSFLPECAKEVFLTIARETIGWGRPWATITRDNFERKTGLSHASIINGIKTLEKLGVIKITQQGKVRQFAITGKNDIKKESNCQDKESLRMAQGQDKKSLPLTECIRKKSLPLRVKKVYPSQPENLGAATISGDLKKILNKIKYKDNSSRARNKEEKENLDCSPPGTNPPNQREDYQAATDILPTRRGETIEQLEREISELHLLRGRYLSGTSKCELTARRYDQAIAQLNTRRIRLINGR